MKFGKFFILFTLLFAAGFLSLNFIIDNNAELTRKPKSQLYTEKFGDVKFITNSASSNIEGISNIKVNTTAGVSEPSAAAFNSNIAVGSNDFTLAGNNARLFLSNDKGASWSTTFVPLSGNGSFTDAADPALAYDESGNLYYAMLHYEVAGNGDGIYVNVSEDNGASWMETAATVKENNDPLQFEDRPAITAGNGKVFVTWTNITLSGNKIYYAYSEDGAQSFSDPVIIASGMVHTSDVILLADGSVMVAYLMNNSVIETRLSSDGVNFGSPVTAAEFVHSGNQLGNAFLLKQDGETGVRVKSYPRIAENAATGELFITFSARNGDDLSDIYLVKSNDRGSSWAEAIRVNSDQTLNDQFLPEILVSNGVVYIVYQDSRDDQANKMVSSYMAVSTDAGMSFTEENISTSSFDPESIMLGNYIGDYTTIVKSGENVVPVWTDGRGAGFDLFAGIIPETVTGVEDDSVIPADFTVAQNYPNPFNPTTSISYSIPSDGFVSVRVYDMLGRLTAKLVDGEQTAGSHNVTFDATSLSSGAYFYTVYHAGNTITKKMLLNK